MRKNTALIIVAVIAAIAIIGVVVASRSDPEPVATVPETTNTEQQPAESTPADSNTSNDTDQAAETRTVSIQANAFDPITVTVARGTTVTWNNMDSVSHTVTPDAETAEFQGSELFGNGESYSVTFNTPGTYTYYCVPHPFMKGTVIVTE